MDKKWTILESVGYKEYASGRKALVKVRCTCGEERIIVKAAIVSGKSIACRKCVRKNYNGKTFGLLKILSDAPDRINTHGGIIRYVNTVCQCTRKSVKRLEDLKRKKVKSCGCQSRKKNTPSTRKAIDTLLSKELWLLRKGLITNPTYLPFTKKQMIKKLGEYRRSVHVDHLIPKSFFKYRTMKSEGFKICWGLDNLQILSAKKNIAKSNYYADIGDRRYTPKQLLESTEENIIELRKHLDIEYLKILAFGD